MHGLTELEEIDYWRERAKRAEAERDAVCSSMCGSNECRIRSQCTKPTVCTSLYAQIDFDAWQTAMHNLGEQKQRADAAESQLAAAKRERDEAMQSVGTCKTELARTDKDLARARKSCDAYAAERDEARSEAQGLREQLAHQPTEHP